MKLKVIIEETDGDGISVMMVDDRGCKLFIASGCKPKEAEDLARAARIAIKEAFAVVARGAMAAMEGL